jgi:UDP-3-O-[3-hydroxymyristoyl] glucosamine N-acyltransferase
MLALQKMLTAVAPRRFVPEPGIHPTAVVDPSCEIAPGAAIGALVVIGPGSKIGSGSKISAGCVIGAQVTIGENCLLHAGCLIADYVQIGNRVVLQQGASIGSDGFGYVTEKTSNLERRLSGNKDLSGEPNPHLKIPQIGTVIVEDDVEIGSNSTIDRATMGATIIGSGSKLDNLVMIAHNCRIGKETIIVSQSGLAGSTSLGDRVIVAGQVGVKDHIRIGDDAIIEAQSGVMRDVAEAEVVCGSPAVPHMEFMTNVAMTRKGEQVYKEVRELKKKVAKLESLLLERQLAVKDN